MRIYRGTVLDTPESPFTGGVLRSADDAGLAVADGVIVARGDFVSVNADHPQAEVVDLRAGVLLPGLVDAHVHYPQVRAIGALGMPLLEWLERCALPEELRLESVDYAREVAAEFVFGLVSAGWFASSLLLAYLLGTGGVAVVVQFLLVLAAALLFLMALPGWILMRAGARQGA